MAFFQLSLASFVSSLRQDRASVTMKGNSMSVFLCCFRTSFRERCYRPEMPINHFWIIFYIMPPLQQPIM